MDLRTGINAALRRVTGYEIRRVRPAAFTPPLGSNPFDDMRRLTVAPERPTVFDVGANVGQTVERTRRTFAHPEIHAFEPAAETFGRLRDRTRGVPDLTLNNVALGAHAGTGELFEHTSGSEMNSLLPQGSECPGETIGSQTVSISTIDAYTTENGVQHIDILKTDAQGFDLDVLRGADATMRDRRIHMVFMEIIFNDMYENVPGLDEVWSYMTGHGFVLVSFYRTYYYRGEKASWTEALFIQPDFVGCAPSAVRPGDRGR